MTWCFSFPSTPTNTPTVFIHPSIDQSIHISTFQSVCLPVFCISLYTNTFTIFPVNSIEKLGYCRHKYYSTLVTEQTIFVCKTLPRFSSGYINQLQCFFGKPITLDQYGVKHKDENLYKNLVWSHLLIDRITSSIILGLIGIGLYNSLVLNRWQASL